MSSPDDRALDLSTLDLSNRAIYRHFVTVTIRYGDEDRMGHVNNAVYLSWLEACRVDYLYSLFQEDETLDIVLARITVDYLRETRYPGEVSVGGVLTRVGNRSVTSGYGVFRGEQCLATCEAVNVFFDPRARSSASPPPAVRDALLAELEQARSLHADASRT